MVELHERHAEARELAEQHRSPVVGAFGECDPGAGAGEREQHRCRGTQAGRVEKRVTALQFAELRLGGCSSRMGIAGVEELAGVARFVVRPDRRTVDRLHPANLAASGSAYSRPASASGRRAHASREPSPHPSQATATPERAELMYQPLPR